MYVGSVFGGFLFAFLIKFVPYWYLLIFLISAHILGFILYGIASNGWMLIVAMMLIGIFTGGEVTLVFNYATDLSSKYVNAFKERGQTFECDQTKAVQIRNYLYAAHSFGYSIGFIIGTGWSVDLSFNSLVTLSVKFIRYILLYQKLYTYMYHGCNKWTNQLLNWRWVILHIHLILHMKSVMP